MGAPPLEPSGVGEWKRGDNKVVIGGSLTQEDSMFWSADLFVPPRADPALVPRSGPLSSLALTQYQMRTSALDRTNTGGR